MPNEQDNAVTKLVNQTTSFEGAGIPPNVKEGFRVPAIDNLKVVRQEDKLGGSLITLSFNQESTSSKSLYYAMVYTGENNFNWAGQNVRDLAITKQKNIQGPYLIFGSPATIFIQSEIKQPATITITTRTPGGIVSELLAQPQVAVQVNPRYSYVKINEIGVSPIIPYDEPGHVCLAYCTVADVTATLPHIPNCCFGYQCTVKNILPSTKNVIVTPVTGQNIDVSVATETLTPGQSRVYQALTDRLGGMYWHRIAGY